MPRADFVGYLQRVEDNLARRRLSARWTFRCGDPAEEIAWYVDRHDVDLVSCPLTHRGEPASVTWDVWRPEF